MNFTFDSPAKLLEKLGGRVRLIRQGKEWTQEDLAARADVTKLTIVKLERGESVSLNTLVAVVSALGRSGDFEEFLRVPEFSPIEMMKLKGKPRQRVKKGSKQKVGGKI